MVVLLGLSSLPPVAGQSGRPDDKGPAPTSPQPPKSNLSKKPKPPRKDPPTTLTITVNPPDSTVQVDNVIAGAANLSGTVTLSNLKPTAPHFIVVRRAGFKDHTQTVELRRGWDTAVSISLEPLPGLLNVATSDGEALVVVKQVGSSREAARHTGAVTEVQLLPGDYLVQTSRSGFKTAERVVSIRSGQSVYLEPKLEQIEVPKPPPPKPFVPAVLTSTSVRVVDNYYLITVQGASGDPDALNGTVDVISSKTDVNLSGAFSGVPCVTELVLVQNVAEASLVEVPAPANRWSRAVLRVKPREQKRLIHVALNWRAISQQASPPSPDTVTPPEAIYKALPVFTSAARNTNSEGSVIVEVTIDLAGDVIAAKAISGPMQLRAMAEDAARKWKFRPAIRNGTPVQSTQRIVFKFQKRPN
jgi:TonB family protein